MPADHRIDDDARMIITSWSGEPTDEELVEALIRYQQEVQGLPRVAGYSELVDFSAISGTRLSASGLATLGEIASRADLPSSRRKLAIVVNSTLTFGLGRLYEITRSLKPSSSKELRVFRSRTDALAWLNGGS